MIPSSVSSRHLATAQVENDHLTPQMDTDEESTVFQGAAVPENGAASASACGALSGLPSEISTSSPVNS